MAYMQNIHSYLHGNACVLLDLAVIMLAVQIVYMIVLH